MMRTSNQLFKLILRWFFEELISRFVKKWLFNGHVKSNNKAVLITGCSTGFGNSLTKRLDSLGFQVLATTRNPLDPAVLQLKKECSSRLRVLPLDVRKADSVRQLFEQVKNSLGNAELWAVVNNAGVLKGYTTEISSLEDIEDVFDINVLGAIRVTKAFLPLLRETKGRIINLGSPCGEVPFCFVTSYGVSKFALRGFTENLRQECRLWGISVVSIEPELFRTGMTSPESKKSFAAMISKLDDSVRVCYGDYYLSVVAKMHGKFLELASPRVEIAVDAMVSAVCLKYPDDVYRPHRGWRFLLIWYLVKVLPQSLVNFVIEKTLRRMLAKSLRRNKSN